MKNILIVEDSKLMQETVKDFLVTLGYSEIKVTAKGSEAVKIINNEPVDLVLTDIILLEALDGIQVGKAANKMDIPVIYMTEFNKSHKFDSGGVYLKKPFTKEELNNNIELIKYKQLIDKKMNQEIHRQKVLLESLDEQVWYITGDEKYALSNKEHMDFFGASKKDFLGKPIVEVLPLVFQRQLLLLLTLARNKRVDIKKKIIVENSSGEEKILEVKVTPRFKDEKIESYICVGKDITSQVETTKNLKQVYDIIKSSTAVVLKWRNDLKWSIDYVSENISQFGYSKEAFMNGQREYSEIIYKKDLNKIASELIDYSKSNLDELKQTYRIVTASGELRWVDDWTIFIRNASNQITHFHGIIVDITDRIEAQEKIRANEKRWKFALESSQYGIWDWNLENDKLYFSKIWKQMLGYEEDEITSSLSEWSKRVHPEDIEEAQLKIQEHIAGKTEFYKDEHRLKHKEGHYIWVKDRGKVIEFDEEGKPLRFIGTHEEITQAKESQRKLEEATHKYEFLFKNAPYGIALIDIETKQAVAYNKKMLDHLGYTREEFKEITINDYEYKEDEEATRKHIQLILEKGFHEFRTIHKRKNGQLREVIVTANIIELNQQQLIYASFRDVTDIVRMQEEFKTYIEQAPYGILVADTSGKYLEINKQARELLGYSKAEIVNLPLEDIFPQELKPLLLEAKERLIREGYLSEEVKIATKMGSLIDVKFTAVKMTNDKLIGFLEDITQSKAMEKKLKEREERLNLAMDAAEHGFWDWDFDSNEVYMSPRYFTMLGYGPNELPMSFDTWKNLLHPEDRNNIVKNIREKIKHGIPFAEEFRLKRKSGDWQWILGRGNSYEVDAEGSPHRAAGTHTDINERKRIEKELRRNEERYRGLVESQKDLIVRVNADKEFTYVNDAYCQAFGKSREELIGESFTPLIHEEDLKSTREAMKSIGKKHYRVYFEHRAMTVNGWRWFAWENYGIKNEAGEITEIQGVGRDITALKEAQIAAEAANKAKSEFLANMSHEIRTPLNTMIGFSDLLEDYIEVKNGEKYLEGIKTAGENLLDLINDILDLSKIEAGKFNLEYQMIDLKDMLNDLYSIFYYQAEEKNIDLSIVIDEETPPVIRTDKTRVRQILLNLIGNAIKFTPEGSVEIHVSAEKDNGKISRLIFQVIDTGIGISKNQQQKIFGAFEQKDGQSTRHYGGTGLGLTISKRLAEMMNGELTLESTFGKGSTFELILKDLDYDHKFINNKAVESISDDFAFDQAVILIVDDSETNIEVLKGWLEKYESLNIIVATSGEEAIEKVKEDTIDLIIMDILMPGLDGFETSEIILKEYPTLPIIAFTAMSKSQLESKIEGYFVDYLLKPVRKEEFIQKVAKYLKYTHKKEADKKRKIELSDELTLLLKENFLEAYQACEKLMVNNEVEAFAKDLIEFSEKHEVPKLLKYAQRLYDYASNFEIRKMEKEFKGLKDLLGGEKNDGQT